MPTRPQQRILDRAAKMEEDRRLDIDITEDLTEAQLASVAFDREVVVYWNQPVHYGIVVGYIDPDDQCPVGLFVLDVVKRAPAPNGDDTWTETGEVKRLSRRSFRVWGPANRDPGDREAELTVEGWVTTPRVSQTPRQMAPFLGAAGDLLAARQMDTGEPAFDIRLDVSVDDEADREQRRRKEFDGKVPRSWRLLAKPTMQPMLQSEIEQVIEVANRYDLCVWHSNAGLELHSPGTIPG